MTAEAKTAGVGQRALIVAAERIFAERGIDGASLREINQAANQRNISATHYHFGSREGLVNAVLQYRLPALDQRRGAILQRQSRTSDMRFYIEAFANPIVEELKPRSEGNYFVRFMQQYERHRGDYETVRRLTPESVRIYSHVEGLLFYLPPEIRAMRLRYLINMIHSVLATAEERQQRGEVAFADVPLIAANMIDAVCAALSAPLSSETIALLCARPQAPELQAQATAPAKAIDLDAAGGPALQPGKASGRRTPALREGTKG